MSEAFFFGKNAEDFAAVLLRRRGYRLLERNYRTPAGEIDIVAVEKGVICFVEVKARRNDHRGSPQDALTVVKRRKLGRAAEFYVQEKGLSDRPARFDVAAVMLTGTGFEMELYKNAFDLEE